MKSRNLLTKIEQSVLLHSTGGQFCPHNLAEIIFPSGEIMKFPACSLCDMPQLRAELDYCDNRPTPRKLERARNAFANSAILFPDEPVEERAAAVASAFGFTVSEILENQLTPNDKPSEA